MLAIAIGMLTFTLVVVLLASTVLLVRRRVMPSGEATLTINDTRQLTVQRGETLLQGLARHGIYLPAACGGRGSCGQCRVRIGGVRLPLLPTEAAHISRRDAAHGEHLACSVTVRDDLDVRIAADLFGAERFACTVRSSRCVSTFMKELVLTLPSTPAFTFEAGDYIVLEAPAGSVRFEDFAIDASFRAEWQHHQLLQLAVELTEPTTRAYSIANHPQQHDSVTLVVRIATPPPRAPRGTPPGKVSSYVFALRPGDPVAISGPFGDFHAHPGEREMVFIGGGAGIAPLRAIIFDQLERKATRRRISFFYGVRSRADLCYQAEFEALAARHPNFSYHVALAEPHPGDDWHGYTGLIHAVALTHYLKDHPAPERIEYYLCGPPLMASAVVAMLEDLGVDRSSIYFDDFGT
jgi:Na+-transporting NADH:ubiquinone oxidoreductase subunit F